MRQVLGWLTPRRGLALLGVALAATASLFAPAADHRDGPIFSNTPTFGQFDVNDVYVFRSPENPNNTVIINTTHPFAGPLSSMRFHPGAVYEVKIDNNINLANIHPVTGTAKGDALEDLTFRFTFSAPDATGAQVCTLRGLPAEKFPNGGLLAQFRIDGNGDGQTVNLPGGGRVTAGIYDDPFFFDGPSFQRFLGANNGRPGTPLTQSALCFGRNFFGPSANTAATVMELPSSQLLSAPNNPRIGVWSRVLFNGAQVDRTGLPAIATALIDGGPTGTPATGTRNRKQEFNQALPRNDERDFRAGVLTVLGVLGNNPETSAALADFLLPDIMPFDTTNAAGFPNGRKLEDDVIDIELSVLTIGRPNKPGDAGYDINSPLSQVTTDKVPNDSTFRNTFPYLGVRNSPAAGTNP